MTTTKKIAPPNADAETLQALQFGFDLELGQAIGNTAIPCDLYNEMYTDYCGCFFELGDLVFDVQKLIDNGFEINEDYEPTPVIKQKTKPLF